MKPTGNTILITGGGSGIGRGLAEALHTLGNKVIIAGRRQQALDETTTANSGMASIQLNIEDPADIRKAAAQLAADHPALNVVIHNAGIMRPKTSSHRTTSPTPKPPSPPTSSAPSASPRPFSHSFKNNHKLRS